MISPPSHLPPDSVVDSLINLKSGWRNSIIIDQCFLPIDAQRTKSIPLSSLPQPDILFWPSSSTGDYSVKTGYKLLCEENQRDKASASNPNPVKKILGKSLEAPSSWEGQTFYVESLYKLSTSKIEFAQE